MSSVNGVLLVYTLSWRGLSVPVEEQPSDIERLTDNCSMYLALVPNILIPSSSVNFQSIDGSLRGLGKVS